MVAMLCFLLLLLLLISSNSDFLAVDVITVHSGEAVRLLSGLTEAEQKHLHDIRWIHSNLLLALKNNMTKCNDGRCELLADGTLSFSHTETHDSGKYLMQAFDKDGKRFKSKEILLQVNSGKSQPNMTFVATWKRCFNIWLVSQEAPLLPSPSQQVAYSCFSCFFSLLPTTS